MTTENIDIRVREDGSRVVSRNLDQIADRSDKAQNSVDKMNKSLDQIKKSGTSLQWLRDNIEQVDSFSSSMVQRFGTNLSQYRNTLMKHFELISKGAKTTASSVKSQMEVLTSMPSMSGGSWDTKDMSAYYAKLQKGSDLIEDLRRRTVTLQSTPIVKSSELQKMAEYYQGIQAADLSVANAMKAQGVYKYFDSLSNQAKMTSSKMKTYMEAMVMLPSQRGGSSLTELNNYYRQLEAEATRANAPVRQLTMSQVLLGQAAKGAGDGQRYWNHQAREAHALARGLSGSMGTLWMTYGSLLPLLTGAALGSVFVNAAKSGSEFAYQLEFVKTLGDESTESIKRLEEQALTLGRRGAFGAVEVASGYRGLAQAGLDAVQQLQVMPDVLNLATAGEVSMEQASISLVGVLNAFNLSIEKSGHVADVFVKAAAVSQTSVDSMTQSMKYASVVGDQYKISVEDTATALALLAKNNIIGTSAGTAFRNMVKELYSPTEQASKVMKQIGLNAADSQGRLRPFAEVIYDLKGKLEDYNQISQVNILQKLFGERGAKEAVAMLSLSRQEWEKLRDSIANADGYSAKIAEDLEKTAKNQWKAALNTLQAELIQAFQRMEPEFVKLAQSFKDLFSNPEFASGVSAILKGFVAIIQAAVDFAPILVNAAKAWAVYKAATIAYTAVITVVSVINSIRAAMAGASIAMATFSAVAAGSAATLAGGSGLVAALGLIANPLGIILALLAAGAAAWVLWGNNAETASQKATKTAQEKLKVLNDEIKYGSGELGKEKQQLEALQQSLALRQEWAAKQKGSVDLTNLKEAQQAVDIQQQLVDKLTERENKLKNIGNIQATVQDALKREGLSSGIKTFEMEGREKSGLSGRLNKDENALAAIRAKLLAAEKEYAIIALTNGAQYELNEGQKAELKIKEQILMLEEKSTSTLKEKGRKQRIDQLNSLKQQLEAAKSLGLQLTANEVLKVETNIAEELRIVQMLPQQRELENKFLQKRIEILKKGGILLEEQENSIRKQLEGQTEINKVIAERDKFIAASSREQDANFQRQIQGLLQISAFTEKDKNAAMVGMSPDLFAGTEQSIQAQLKIYEDAYAKIDALRNSQLINEQTAHQLRIQNASAMAQKLIELEIQASNTRLQLGTGTWADMQISALAKVTQGFTTFQAGASQAMGSFFQSFTDGFANSIGRAIVYSENLGDALNNVAKEALAGLISALVKLGIQWVVNAALSQALGASAMASQTAMSMAAGAATAAAWAPAAAMVSLASFGANSAAAMAGITATTALSQSLALASMAGFEMGGYTGNVGTKEIAGLVHGREFVFDAVSTQRIGVDNLEAIRNGALDVSRETSMRSLSNYGSTAGHANITVSIENYGSSKEFDVQQISENEVRIIARDEARSIVRADAPSLVASEIRNPNSSISKSLGQNTQTQRRRT